MVVLEIAVRDPGAVGLDEQSSFFKIDRIIRVPRREAALSHNYIVHPENTARSDPEEVPVAPILVRGGDHTLSALSAVEVQFTSVLHHDR